MIAVEILRQHLRYSPSTGNLWWKLPGHKRKFDRPAGYLNGEGYREICMWCVCMKAHRVIWALVTGEWPVEEVDHKNTKRDDNRWKNLRLATHGQNQHNTLGYKNNTSGRKGVTWNKAERKWRAQIQVAKKRTTIGRFSSVDAAHAAYRKAARKHFGEYARF